MKKIKFYFMLRSSHAAATSGFSGKESTVFDDGNFLENIDHLGYSIVSARVQRSGDTYEAIVDFVDEIDLADAKYFAEAFASLTTHYLSYNINHYYGSPYIEIDFGAFYRDNGDGHGLKDHVSISIERSVQVSSLPTDISELHELVHFYFLGMQSNNIKAKFFNLFLILEAIEGSIISRSTFTDGTLFSEHEKTLISETASKMSDDRKKSVINSVLSRTDQSRHDKLHSVLAVLGVTQFSVLGDKATPVSVKSIKDLIEARNKLFHKGSSIDENLIWGTLIPLTREIVKLLLTNPKALTL
jgi:hypothetical protein